MKTVPSVSSSEEEVTIKYVCGIDVGSQSCSGCICGPGKRVVVKASDFANTKEGWKVWEEKLTQLDATPNLIIIGMEATSRYQENRYHELEQKGYQMRLLHPGQTHHYHQQQGRLSQDRSARCHDYCSRLAEWRSACGLYSQRADCYVPRSGAFAYPVSREEAARYQNQIQVLVVVLIPFVQSDLC